MDIYFCEDLSGGHSLCLNDENKNEGVKKFTSEMQSTCFYFFYVNIQENLTLLYPRSCLSSLLQNRLSLTQVVHLFLGWIANK